MSTVSDSRDGRRKPPPLSSHPAFATLVALWFSALLGLGSLFLPALPLEHAAALLGFDASASPLLRLVGKLIVAAIAGYAGFRLGKLVARAVVHAQLATDEGPRDTARPPTMRDIERDLSRRQPISAHAELGMEGFGPVTSEEFAPEDSMGQFDTRPFAPPVDTEGSSPWLADEDGRIFIDAPSEIVDEAPTSSEPDATHNSDPAPAAEHPSEPAESPIAERPLAELGMVELIERLAHAIQRKHGLARCLPPNAAEMVRRLDADVQASNAAYASLADIRNCASADVETHGLSHGPSAEPAVTFPALDARRANNANEPLPPVPGGIPGDDPLRSALETLRRMSGTA